MKSQTLWLADHELKNALGHHLNFNIALAEGALKAGLKPVLLCRRDFRFPAPIATDVRGIFRADWRRNPPMIGRQSRCFLDFLDQTSRKRFLQDLSRGLPSTTGPRRGDLVLAQMLAPRHLAGWARWLAQRNSVEAPVVFAHLGYDASRFAADAGLQNALRDLAVSNNLERLCFLSDSEPLARRYKEVFRRQVYALSHVVSPELKPSPQAAQKEFLTVSVLGNPRREKGFLDVVDALTHLAGKPGADKLRFVLQVNDPDQDCLSAARRLQTSPRQNIFCLTNQLTESEYIGYLKEADVLLIPYHLDAYRERTSGIFCEALAAGKPVITTADSWMSAYIQKTKTGWLVRERNPADLADLLLRLPDEFSAKQSIALRYAPAFAEEFSVNHFIKNLLRIAGDDSE